MKKIRILLTALLTGLCLLLIACGSASPGGTASDVPADGDPEKLANEIVNTWSQSMQSLVALLEGRPEASAVRDRVEQMKEDAIQELVALGLQREALSDTDKATVDSLEWSGMQTSGRACRGTQATTLSGATTQASTWSSPISWQVSTLSPSIPTSSSSPSSSQRKPLVWESTGVKTQEPADSPRYVVTFEPAGRREEAGHDEDLMTIAWRAGVEIESSCGGKGSCGKCRVRVQSGPVTPPTQTELRLLSAESLAAGLRLACQTRLLGDARVHVPEESRRDSQVGAKHARERARALDPAVRTYVIDPPASAGAGETGAAREPGTVADLTAALAQQHGLTGLTVESTAAEAWAHLTSGPPAALVAVVWQGRAAAEGAAPTATDAAGAATPTAPGAPGGAVLDVRPASAPGRVPGLALDVGTTTIAAYLADLTTGEIIATEAALNPQVAYGDDIIARLQYAAHHAHRGR